MVVNGMVPLASDMLAHQPIKEWVKSTKEFHIGFQIYFLVCLPMVVTYTLLVTSISYQFLLFNAGVKQWFYLSLGGLGLYCFLRFKNISYFSSIFVE